MSVLIWTSDGKRQTATHKTCTFALKGLKRGHKLSANGSFPKSGGFTFDFWGSEEVCKSKAEAFVELYDKVEAE